MSYTQSPLVFYNDNTGNPGIFLEWERVSTNASYYNILRSDYFDGVYDILDTVDYPQNEYVDVSGKPSSYYKIEEYDAYEVLLNTSQPMVGDELLTKSIKKRLIVSFNLT